MLIMGNWKGNNSLKNAGIPGDLQSRKLSGFEMWSIQRSHAEWLREFTESVCLTYGDLIDIDITFAQIRDIDAFVKLQYASALKSLLAEKYHKYER
jgi:hypothetical protein